MSARTVAVLGGGRSSEHDVSLASAAAVRQGLDEAGYAVLDVRIERDGRWRHGEEAVTMTPAGGLLGADAVFPVLHGPWGEDGTVQGLLEILGVPYVGAGVLASALCMDKVAFKDRLAHAAAPQVAYEGVTAAEWATGRAGALRRVARLDFPMFVKPNRLGSSVGIGRVASADELPAALEVAFAHDSVAIAEALGTGREIECSVIGNDEPVASEPGEVLLAAGEGGWYDYEAKYTPGGMELVVPARISDTARARVRELAEWTFALVGCSGLARVDFFVDGEDVLVNELNTMPGQTSTSAFAKLFAASGVEYPELLRRLVAFALERHEAAAAYAY
jgi:D-alanine-D-alanine ligase